MCVCSAQIWNHPDILHQIISQRKDDNDLDIDDAKTTDVTPAARRSRAKTSRMASALSSTSLMSSAASSSRLSMAASTDSLISASSLSATPSTDSMLPSSRLSATASASSLLSMSGLNLTPGTDSMMSETSRVDTGSGKYDFSSVKFELAQSAGAGNNPPACIPGSMMSDASQPDMVKFTTGHSMDFMTSDSSAGGSADVKPTLADVDLRVGAGRTEDWMSKKMDWKCEKDEMMMKMVNQKDDVMMKVVNQEEPVMCSVSAAETKTSSSLSSAVALNNSETADLMELKPESDKPGTSGDAVATSNVTSSSSAAAASNTSATAGSESTAVMSASDLKKESQAINYDWVSA